MLCTPRDRRLNNSGGRSTRRPPRSVDPRLSLYPRETRSSITNLRRWRSGSSQGQGPLINVTSLCRWGGLGGLAPPGAGAKILAVLNAFEKKNDHSPTHSGHTSHNTTHSATHTSHHQVPLSYTAHVSSRFHSCRCLPARQQQLHTVFLKREDVLFLRQRSPRVSTAMSTCDQA